MNEETGIRVFKTKDYGQFKKQIGNRIRSEADYKGLSAAIEADNMLKYNPILVNDKMEVIDGQTRLGAAEKLDKSIYYIVGNGLKIYDTQMMNSNMKKWSNKDYMESHIAQGNTNYIKLKEFMISCNTTLTTALDLLGYDYHALNRIKFTQKGDFNFKDDKAEEGREVMRMFNELTEFIPGPYYNQRALIRAIRQSIGVKNYDHKYVV